jgi:hypothetical protein
MKKVINASTSQPASGRRESEMLDNTGRLTAGESGRGRIGGGSNRGGGVKEGVDEGGAENGWGKTLSAALDVGGTCRHV